VGGRQRQSESCSEALGCGWHFKRSGQQQHALVSMISVCAATSSSVRGRYFSDQGTSPTWGAMLPTRKVIRGDGASQRQPRLLHAQTKGDRGARRLCGPGCVGKGGGSTAGCWFGEAWAAGTRPGKLSFQNLSTAISRFCDGQLMLHTGITSPKSAERRWEQPATRNGDPSACSHRQAGPGPQQD
jgi:hypothetical protein